MDQVTEAEPSTLYCARHPQVETVLRCGRCETPICPRCSVTTPVGARCPACAQVRKPPTYDVSGRYLWRAVAAAVVLALGGGFAFGFLAGFAGRSLIIGGILYALVGIGIAEGLSAVANRKRGPRLQLLAVATTVIVTQWPTILALVVVQRFALNPLALLLTVVAAVIAWGRLR